MAKRGPKKGAPKTPGSGRKKGVPNRKTLELRAQLEALGMGQRGQRGFDHPVVWMTKVYAGLVTMEVVNKEGDIERVAATPELRVRCATEVAQYLEPKRKAMEVSGPGGEPLGIPLVDLTSLPELSPQQRRAQQALLAHPKLVSGIVQWLDKRSGIRGGAKKKGVR